MNFEIEPLRSYVRFYLTVVDQLRGAVDEMATSHGRLVETVGAAMGELAHPETRAAADWLSRRPEPPAELAQVWQPEDGDALSGLTDVYEVVGRFSFQGPGDANLARVERIVSALRRDIAAARSGLSNVSTLHAALLEAAKRLEQDELRACDGRKESKLKAFQPLAQTLLARAKQTLEAVRAAPIPELDNLETAAQDYQKYAQGLEKIYQTCVHYLQKALLDMAEASGCEVPQAWSDTLPIQKELPEDYLRVPPLDSPEVQQSGANVSGLEDELFALQRTRDDLLVTITRIEGDIEAETRADPETLAQVEIAARLVALAKAKATRDDLARHIMALSGQRSSRTSAVGELLIKQKQLEHELALADKAIRDGDAETLHATQRLAEERENEPALFGKDAWILRVAALEQDADELRQQAVQKRAQYNHLQMDLSSIAVQIQTEQAQTALCERALAEANARERALLGEIAKLEADLGPHRPARDKSVAEAEDELSAIQGTRAEQAQRIERLRTEIRRKREEIARVDARERQIAVEKGRAASMLENAKMAASQGREAAQRQLAIQRQRAVRQHVEEVLAVVATTLSGIEDNLIEPARKAMLASEAPDLLVVTSLRAHAERLTPNLPPTASEVGARLDALEQMLEQVQRGFCDVAPRACRDAWSS